MTDFLNEDNSISALVALYEASLRGERFSYFDVFDYVDIVEYYLSQLQEDKAQDAIEAGLSQHNDAVELLYKQAEVFVLKGMQQKALQLIEDLSKNNDDTDFYLLQGRVFCAIGKYAEANIAFQMALDREEESTADLYFRIGLSFQHVFEFRLALRYHYKLYEQEPENLENLFEVAYCYEQLDKLKNSIRFYNKYLDIAPYSHKVWYNLGIVYNRLQNYEEAIEAYDYALAIRPKHSKAFFNKGNALFYLQRYKEALTCYFTYLNYEDNHSFTNTYIGECYEKLGVYESAILHYKKALQIDDKLSDAWFGLGIVAKLQSRENDAIYYMEKAAKADETYAECYAELGELYTIIGEDALAVNAYRYAIIAEPEVWQYHLDLAKFYHKKSDISQALRVLEAVKKEFAGEAELFYYLSLFSLLMGDKQTAKEYFKNAQKIDNEQFDAILNYCRKNQTLVTKGQIDELLKLN